MKDRDSFIDTKGGIDKRTSDCLYTRAGMLPPPEVSVLAVVRESVSRAIAAKIDRQMMGLAALILLALLTGCATENVKQALDNLDRDCTRHYAFALSSGGVGGVGGSGTLTGTADCQPSGKPAPGAPAATPAPGQ